MNSMKPHIREYSQEIKEGMIKQCYKRKKEPKKMKFYLKKNKNHAVLKKQ